MTNGQRGLVYAIEDGGREKQRNEFSMEILIQDLLRQAELRHRQGDVVEAIAGCRSALSLVKNHPEALLRLGALLAQRGDLEEAVVLLSRAVEHNPAATEGYNNLGAALHDLGRDDEAVACYERAIDISPLYCAALSNLGVALTALGRHDDAVVRFLEALAVRPDDADALSNLGVTLQAVGRNQEAMQRFKAALTSQPGHAQAAANLGHAQVALGLPEDALGSYRVALTQRPNDPQLHVHLAHVYSSLNRTQEAIESCRRACALQPAFAEAHAALAVGLLEAGRIDEARQEFERAIALDPREARYFRGLTICTELTEGDTHLVAMQNLAANVATLADKDAVQLHYALSKTLGDLGKHEEAFVHLLQGASLHRRTLAYDEEQELGSLRRAATLFTPEIMLRGRGRGIDSQRPVFIVGMPRSGSTLVEQILASHPQVAGLGEVDAFEASVRSVISDTSLLPGAIGEMKDVQMRALGHAYMDRIDGLLSFLPHALGVTRVTDKKLDNLIYVGLIHLALPNARIVHTKRDPIDTCLSCFSLLFKEMEYTYDLAELGRRYHAYQKLMAHWHEVLTPGTILDVNYEDLVANPEMETRRLVAHCGLDWDPSCLAFHTSERPVRTASVVQVRRPIYRTAIGRWRPDESILRPLLTSLKEHVATPECLPISTTIIPNSVNQDLNN